MSEVMALKPDEVVDKLRKGDFVVCVVGLGWMGMPTACLFAEMGARVIGVDVDRSIVDTVNKGKSPVAEPGLDVLVKKTVGKGQLHATDDVKDAISKSDIVILIVPTLLDRLKRPDYSTLEKACKDIGHTLKKGSLVILQSTVGLGITESLVKWELEKASGLKVENDFGLAYSPIRATSGRTLQDIVNYPRVVAAIDKRSLEVASAVLATIIKGPIIKVRNVKTAEAIKLFENVYRDTNIALANELATFCEAAAIDYAECVKAANTQPYCHLHMPGIGVGGHCIPVNPYFLLEEAANVGVKLPLIKLARKTNDAMPKHTVNLVIDALRTCGKSVKRARIAVLGVSYRANVKEARFTPTKEVVATLEKMGAKISVYDPYFTVEELKTLGYYGVRRLEVAVDNADCVLITVEHEEFKRVKLKTLTRLLRKKAALVDCGRVFNPSEVEAAGIVYRGIGRGTWSK